MKRKTRIPRLPVAPHPDAALRAYAKLLHKYANAYIRLTKSKLKELVPELKDVAADEIPEPQKISRSDSSRMDAGPNIAKKVQDLLASVGEELEDIFPDALLAKWAKSMAGQVNRQAKKQTAKVAKKVGLEVEPMMHDRGLSPWLQNIVDENVSLIQSIPKKKLETFKNGLVALITADAPQDQIRELIDKHFSGVRVNARLIARDQVGKLNGKINQYRQEQLGGKRYIWRGADDERERKDHRKLNGTTHKWSDPPIVDRGTGRRAHPGEDFQCRCRAEMVLEDILE
jgi:SPP1 gp7 family putative phage head morphogenesis protein